MRASLLALLACTAPTALFADVIEARSKLVSVTIFPYGAQVTREISVTAPEGQHELRIPDLPAATDAASLRLSGDGVDFGAVSLAVGRQAAVGDLTAPEVKSARAALKAAEAALAGQELAVAEIRAQARAAEEEIAFLRGQKLEGASPEALSAMAKLVGEQALSATRTALKAEAEAKTAEAELTPAREAVERARAALAAVENPAETATLTATVQGAGTLTITTFVQEARWTPAYDIRLDRAGKTLDVERSVLVSQASGEDWTGVALTLSTARPSEQSGPSALWPRRLSADEPMVAPQTLAMAENKAFAEAAMADAASAQTMRAAPAPQMEMGLEGQTVVYKYPTAVDLRDGVEDLRLALDQLSLPAKVSAEAVPMLDASAYLTARAENTGEILLAGPARLYEGNALKGAAELALTPTGKELRLGFGAIDGLRLKRIEPETMEGGRGFITKSNARHEVALLSIENLTQEAWPLRVLDRLPYSEQEDLTITTTATPEPTETDIDDQRGISAWEFEIAAGATEEIRIESEISWPEGKTLTEN